MLGFAGSLTPTYALALVKNGDIIIDAEKCLLSIDVSDKALKKRIKAWKKPKPRYTHGVLAKYATLVCSASESAVTDKDLFKKKD